PTTGQPPCIMGKPFLMIGRLCRGFRAGKSTRRLYYNRGGPEACATAARARAPGPTWAAAVTCPGRPPDAANRGVSGAWARYPRSRLSIGPGLRLRDHGRRVRAADPPAAGL